MEPPSDLLARIRAINDIAAFNRWCRHRSRRRTSRAASASRCPGATKPGSTPASCTPASSVRSSTPPAASPRSRWWAACWRRTTPSTACAPAVGHRFIARARVIKPGKSQVFTACELFAENAGAEKLVATGETLLLVVGAEAGA